MPPPETRIRMQAPLSIKIRTVSKSTVASQVKERNALTSDPTPQRRRGAVLEKALLDAAWAELNDHGYDEFTIDASPHGRAPVAPCSTGVGRKPELVHAALVNAVGEHPVVAADTGSLRGDVIAVLRQANKRRARLAVVLFTRLGGFYRDTGTNLSELSAFVRAAAPALSTNSSSGPSPVVRSNPVRSGPGQRDYRATCSDTTY